MGWIIVFFLGGGRITWFSSGTEEGGGEFSQRQKSIKGD